jgi:RNA recognition motif-containing protein
MKFEILYNIINLNFFRYAFILYDDEEQANYVIEHADQYKINGQPLSVSVYRNKK